MNATQLIESYERVLGYTRWMVAAARGADWERLVDLERSCREEVDRLMALGPAVPRLPGELETRKAEIIRGVLADDAEIRRITEPWMARLEEVIGETRNCRRLSRAYGAGA
ncbi:MAG: flagellar protein FliT [Burkholderiales bacterium]|nr:flagellar protein FliT [Burkholderiales bacterium]